MPNNVEIVDQACSITPNWTFNENTYIGNYDDSVLSTGYNGLIDDVIFYDSALTPKQVQNLYDSYN